MYKKLTLINSPISDEYCRSIRTGTYPPPSLGSIAAYVKLNNLEIEVEIYDGEILTSEEIISKLDADVVGVSVNIMTYEPGLQIAESAAAKGARVVIGGPFVDSMADRIVRNRPFIDGVIVGEGELPMSMYLAGKPKELIPGLVYASNGQVIRNPVYTHNLNSLPIPDYCNLPLEQYFQNYRERYAGFKPFNGSLAVYSRKGCIWREKTNGGCVFCMIPHRGMQYKTPENLWKEISFFNKEYGANYFWEVSDTFTEENEWIEEFLHSRPKGLDIAFHVYGRPNHITPRMARLLKELNVFEVFIGAESGDDQILQNMVKGCKVSHTLRAIESLANEGILTIVSFVFGLPGETQETLEKTVKLAEQIVQYQNVIETSSSVLLPIPGSPAFDILMQYPGMKDKHSSDLLDLEELKKDWAMFCTNVNYDVVVEAKMKTLELFPLNNTFSQVGKQSAPMC
jgi:anaerobic magnesium-protoporphyrin IX monomethyl ester cyclase